MTVAVIALTACTHNIGGRTPFVFGIIGDQTGASDLADAYKILERGVGRLLAERPSVVLHTGDLVESTLPENAYREMFQRGTSLLGKLSAPWYLTAGDHDVNPTKSTNNEWSCTYDSDDRSRETLFRSLYGAQNPLARDRLYYSFDAGGYHFISLYSHEAKCVDPRWGPILLARISKDQRQWLEDDLKHHATATGTIVFLHQPLWYNWPGWSDVHALLRRYQVTAVIAGHFHYNQDDGEIDGVRYLVVGATGGDIKRGNAAAGGIHHVTLVKLRGRDRPAGRFQWINGRCVS